MSDIALFIILIIISIIMLIILAFIFASCKVSSNCDYYDEKTLDDDITMENILDQMSYDDTFVKKEVKDEQNKN